MVDPDPSRTKEWAERARRETESESAALSNRRFLILLAIIVAALAAFALWR